MATVVRCLFILMLSCNSNNSNNFVTLLSTRLRLPEDDADALKHAGVLTKILLIYIYICCAFVGLKNKLYFLSSFSKRPSSIKILQSKL